MIRFAMVLTCVVCAPVIKLDYSLEIFDKDKEKLLENCDEGSFNREKSDGITFFEKEIERNTEAPPNYNVIYYEVSKHFPFFYDSVIKQSRWGFLKSVAVKMPIVCYMRTQDFLIFQVDNCRNFRNFLKGLPTQGNLFWEVAHSLTEAFLTLSEAGFYPIQIEIDMFKVCKGEVKIWNFRDFYYIDKQESAYSQLLTVQLIELFMEMQKVYGNVPSHFDDLKEIVQNNSKKKSLSIQNLFWALSHILKYEF